MKSRKQKLREALAVLKQKYGLNDKPGIGKQIKVSNSFYQAKTGSEFVLCILKYYFGGDKAELDLNSKRAFTKALVEYFIQEKYQELFFSLDQAYKTVYAKGQYRKVKGLNYIFYAKEIARQLSYLEYEPLVDREALKYINEEA